MNLPWWLWVLAVVVIAFLVFFGSWKHYRTTVRERFLAYLETEHPEIQVGEVTSNSVTVTTDDGGEGTVFLDRLYRESAQIELEDEGASRELFSRFAGMILEGQGALSIDADRARKIRGQVI